MASPSINVSYKIILLTGEPGVGKTTLIKKIFEKLKKNNFNPVIGFITEEVRNQRNIRIGFDVIDINDQTKKSALARIKELSVATSMKPPLVGKYVVDVQSFESIALENIKYSCTNKIYIIDEIGKMEMFSSEFEKGVIDLLQKIEKNPFLIIATVPSKSLKLSDMFKSHYLTKVFTVNHHNRDRIDGEILDLIKKSYNEFSNNDKLTS